MQVDPLDLGGGYRAGSKGFTGAFNATETGRTGSDRLVGRDRPRVAETVQLGIWRKTAGLWHHPPAWQRA
jgi:hypothetical protein